MKKANPLVSIVMPAFNAERFLVDTIHSVQSQTYRNWELIIIDDCSTDGSSNVVKEAVKTDSRITLLKNQANEGAGHARNAGIRAAKGRYLAFIDADDLWDPRKLEKQVAFMMANSYAFAFTAYEFANASGRPSGRRVHVPAVVTYDSMLKSPIAWTSTIMIDLGSVEKKDIYMPDIRRGQDLVSWLNVLLKVGRGYGLNEVLSYYRRTSTSLSANKINAAKRTWYIYRRILNIGTVKSVFYMVNWSVNATKKRVGL